MYRLDDRFKTHWLCMVKWCMWKKSVIFIHLFDSGILLIIDLNKKSEIFRHKTSHMVLSIIFLEDKHNILLQLSILYEYQQFFQHPVCFSIQPQLQLVNLHRNRRYFVIMVNKIERLYVKSLSPWHNRLWHIY
jgi:hypothetical protein